MRLGRVLDDLGATLLTLVHGEPRADELGGVTIHDPLEDGAAPRHALVLGVGVREPAETVALLRQLGRAGAAGLVLRAPVPSGPAVAAAARESGVAVLALTAGASWTQLAAMLRAMLAEGDVGGAGPETLGGIPSGDLFALANAVAALIDAPVTIEDRASRVLAFSGRQDEADPGRVATVLGRQVPERYARSLTASGVFRKLYASDEPLFIDSLDLGGEEFVPRVAVAVRAGDEVLGSIWAAVRKPLSTERTQALRDAARLVALHLLRVRAGADVERRLRADLLGTALEGGPGARDALGRLGLAGQPVVVLALAPVAGPVDAASLTERQRLSDAFALHLSAMHPRCAAALLGDVAYGLLPAEDEQRAVRIAEDFLERVGDRTPAAVGVGPPAADGAGLAGARAGADRALRVLRAGRGSGRRVATLADVQVEALLLDLRDLVTARGDRPGGPVGRLIAYDDRHHAKLLETLRAWLEAFGDVAAAAAAVHVHPNTFRYRLRRVAEVGGLDLADPDARFAAMIQLRVIAE
ncbi:PucR family transcriptional regulator [Actinoplanes sp. NBRC 14428]|uniref:DNA-binding PucR family transcriptional regulator n=1 Tax=Pseudosporangium ferrugineum TaxID=439699 RepID=A0A2T0SIA3_9ACTN|nr:helix-turn-helix domain-containing protein [Pseudosporangium ferrugineum]PRY33148.1 DNA-binding PucR family transcriptional regulator [Pseudosporangium ferrugineum]BCJ48868.1 PucR family transcriptional regulator [Actinoplanes sp. NBRC 14428]